MARKLDNDWDFLSPEEIQLLSMHEPVEPGVYSVDWLRCHPQLTTDRLMELSPNEKRETRDYDEGHL